MANEKSILPQIQKYMQTSAQQNTQFRQAAAQHNSVVAKSMKDLTNFVFSQKKSFSDISNSVQESIAASEKSAVQIQRNNSLLNDSISIQGSMLAELKNINANIRKLITAGGIGGSGTSGGVGGGSLLGGVLSSRNLLGSAGLAAAAGGGAVVANNVMGGNAGSRNAPSAGGADVQRNKQLILREMNSAGIKDPQTRAAIAAVISEESGFKTSSEKAYTNTSAENIRKSFGQNSKIGKQSDDFINNLKKNPEAFFNYVYGGRLGNASNEGYMYRGRGYIQLTGKSNYAKYSQMVFGDDRLVKNPDLLLDPEIAAKVTVAYIKDRTLKNRGSTYENVARGVGNANQITEGRKKAAYNTFLQSGEFGPDKVANVQPVQAGISPEKSTVSTASGITPSAGAGVSGEGTPVNTSPQATSEPLSAPTRTGENGRLPDSALTSIGGNHRLVPVAAAAYEKMVEAARKDGITWTVTDSYRTYEQQVKLARTKGLYSQGGLAARPGTSNHGWGLAVDLGGGANRRGTPQNNWLVQNAHKFGFRTIPREAWHWEYAGAGAAAVKGSPATRGVGAERGGSGPQNEAESMGAGGMPGMGGAGPMMGMGGMPGMGGMGGLPMMGMMGGLPMMGMMGGRLGAIGALGGLAGGLIGTMLSNAPRMRMSDISPSPTFGGASADPSQQTAAEFFRQDQQITANYLRSIAAEKDAKTEKAEEATVSSAERTNAQNQQSQQAAIAGSGVARQDYNSDSDKSVFSSWYDRLKLAYPEMGDKIRMQA